MLPPPGTRRNGAWPCVLMHSCNNLVSLKLLREAYPVRTEATLQQSVLFAIMPIALVRGVLYARGVFGGKRAKAGTGA